MNNQNQMKCPVCKTDGELLIKNGKDYFILNGNSPDFDIYYCTKCKIANSFPYLSDAELAPYYPEEYEAYKPKKSLAQWLQTIKYKGDLKIICDSSNQNKNLSLFEIGAGRGEFLNEAKKIGLHVEGIEPGDSGVKYAKNTFNVELQTGFASQIKFNKTYDVVVARHVLEHINEYHACLKLIIDSGLKTGGSLYIKIPRMDSWEAKFFKNFWSGYDLPRHRVHYSKAGMIKMLTDLGYKEIKIKSEVVPADIMRSIRYHSIDGSSALLKLLSKAFSALPNMVKMVISQIIGILFSPFGAGRMIIIAKK